jgi:hypothetical protein
MGGRIYLNSNLTGPTKLGDNVITIKYFDFNKFQNLCEFCLFVKTKMKNVIIGMLMSLK